MLASLTVPDTRLITDLILPLLASSTRPAVEGSVTQRRDFDTGVLPRTTPRDPRRRVDPPFWLHWVADPCDGVKGLERPRGAVLLESTGQGSRPRASPSACGINAEASASWLRCAARVAARDVEADCVAARGCRRVRDGG